MSTVNVYFSQGIKNEQYLIEDLIIESLRIYGQELIYIPRTLVAKDEILGEDRLSTFTNSFPIEMYFEDVDSFAGQGAFIQKFGLMMEQSATLVVARRRWEQLVGRHDKTIIPTRPCEGDLLYFPLTKGLFEIKFVQHQDPFYQLGKLYVYKLQVELFQYSSERIETGMPEVDVFESLKSFTTDTVRNQYGEVVSIQVTNMGSGYTTVPTLTFVPTGSGSGAAAIAVLGTGVDSDKIVSATITNPGTGYTTAPSIVVNGDGSSAVLETTIATNIDKSDSYGDNNQFKKESVNYLFNESNPFGDVS